MQYLIQSTTLMGTVTNIDSANTSFTMRCRSGDIFQIHVSPTTVPGVLTNLDELNRDRVPAPDHFDRGTDWVPKASELVRKYLHLDALVVVQGIYMEHEDEKRFEARYVTLMHSDRGSISSRIPTGGSTRSPAWGKNGWMTCSETGAPISWTILRRCTGPT